MASVTFLLAEYKTGVLISFLQPYGVGTMMLPISQRKKKNLTDLTTMPNVTRYPGVELEL